MKIERVTIKNFKGIQEIDQEIHGKNVWLKGGNGQNKSNFIDAIFFGLTGKKAPTKQTHNGAKKGLIEIDLGDFIARTKLKDGKPNEFELENKVFSKESERFISAPRTYLSQRIGVIDFDVNDFFAMTDAEKLKYLAKILDADFSAIDTDIEEVIESRKFDKKEIQKLNTKVEYFSEEDAAKDPIDILLLSNEINDAENSIQTRQRVSFGIDTRKSDIEEIKAEIKKLEDKWLIKSNEIKEAQDWLESTPVDIEELEAKKLKLANANSENEKIKKAKEAKQVDKDIEEIAQQVLDADKELEKLRAKKAKLIGDSIKVPGLEYNVAEEKFYYKGLPFEKQQINTASQLIAGMHIASSLLKELRIVKIDASLVDKVNFEKALLWANENDVEMFIELVDREATQLSITIE